LKETAHALKGSSANLGAPRLAALCAELQELGSSGELTAAADVVSQLETELDRVRSAFHAELEKTTGH
jgi:two-component system sensor histidine kinase/response regulator